MHRTANVIAIVQARMTSTRLRGKVLCSLAGEPMLGRVVRRALRATSLREVVVATSEEPEDEPIEDYCWAQGWPVFRGSLHDVLDRYYRAATEHRADVVVRITADCPVIDPQLIDRVVGEFQRHDGVDYVSCILPPRTFPRGLDVEAISYEALKRTWDEASEPFFREHVTPYILHHTDQFSVRGIFAVRDLSHFRWTVDELKDLQLVEQIYRHFGHDRFGWQDIVAAYSRHDEWNQINAHVRQKAA